MVITPVAGSSSTCLNRTLPKEELMWYFVEVLLNFIEHDPGAFVAFAGDDLDVFWVY
jgi:hypothetical protein